MDAELERIGDVRLDREEDVLSFGRRVDLFESQERSDRLNTALDQVRDRLGEVAVVPAATLRQRRGRSHVPFGAVSPRTVRTRD